MHKKSMILRTHVGILLFRLLLLAMAVVLFFADNVLMDFTTINAFSGEAVFTGNTFFLWLVWLHLLGGMVLRIFPNKIITLGARKHFLHPGTGAQHKTVDKEKLHRGALYSFLGWFVCTAASVAVLHFLSILSPPIVLIIALVYAVLDSLFILFFCPFQALFMKNHCCTTCRIYNWDYLMMCAPLMLFPSFFSASLVILSLAVFIQWEWALRKNPAKFSPETNPDLTCKNCNDKLCKLRR